MGQIVQMTFDPSNTVIPGDRNLVHWSSAAPGVGTYFTLMPTSDSVTTATGAGNAVPSKVTVTGIPT
jgi:hypothetical protein